MLTSPHGSQIIYGLGSTTVRSFLLPSFAYSVTNQSFPQIETTQNVLYSFYAVGGGIIGFIYGSSCLLLFHPFLST
jgi:hypothetical protein